MLALVPYVGLGVGFAINETGKRDMSACASTYPSCSTPAGSSNGARKTSFAGAAMLGVTRTLFDAWKLDANYRYLYMGDAETGKIDASVGDRLEFDDLSAHELRVGIRYDLHR